MEDEKNINEDVKNIEDAEIVGEGNAPEQSGPIEKERVDRILSAERLSINREILEALVGFVYDYMMSQQDYVKAISDALDDASKSGKKKRKISIDIKTAKALYENEIKFMFRMQGTITRVQEDIDGIDSPDKNETNESVEG